MDFNGSSWRLFEDRICDLPAHRGEGDYLHAASVEARHRRRSLRAVSVNRHTADCHEFFLAVEGRVLIETPSQVFELTPGKLLLVEPGVEHEELPGSPHDSYLVFCLMTPGTTADLWQTLYLPHTNEDVLNYHLSLIGSEPLSAAAAMIGTELGHRRERWLQAVEHQVRYLGLVLQRRLASGSFEYQARTVAKSFRRYHPLEGAMFYCAANLRRPIRLRDVASAVGYSPSYLSRMFSEQLGVSFSEHLRNLRMTIATNLLSRSDLSVQEIAQRVGYQYPWHFTRAFVQATGVSPRQYRQQQATS